MSVSCNTAAHFSTKLFLSGSVTIPVGAADTPGQIYHAIPASPYAAGNINDSNCIPTARSTFLVVITDGAGSTVTLTMEGGLSTQYGNKAGDFNIDFRGLNSGYIIPLGATNLSGPNTINITDSTTGVIYQLQFNTFFLGGGGFAQKCPYIIADTAGPAPTTPVRVDVYQSLP